MSLVVCSILCKLNYIFFHIFHNRFKQGIILAFPWNFYICVLQNYDCLSLFPDYALLAFLNRPWWLPPTIHKKFWKRKDQWRTAATHHSSRAWGTGSHSHWPPRTDTGSSWSAMCIGKWFLASLVLLIWFINFQTKTKIMWTALYSYMLAQTQWLCFIKGQTCIGFFEL